MRPGKARIAFKNVSVRFPTPGGGQMQVVDDVTYDIGDREFVSVIGPSGCGKTTMMNIVAGFMQPSAGSVTLDGTADRRPRPGPRRHLPGLRRLSLADGEATTSPSA